MLSEDFTLIKLQAQKNTEAKFHFTCLPLGKPLPKTIHLLVRKNNHQNSLP